MHVLAWTLLSLSILMTVASLLKKQEWWVRMFDLPRLQVLVFGVIALGLFVGQGPLHVLEWCALGALFSCLVYQARKVLPYTVFAPTMAKKGVARVPEERISLITANVLGTNRQAEKFLCIVEKHDPDLVLTLESDLWWEAALAPLERDRPFTVKVPLDNLYGMHLFSRCPLRDTEVRYLIENDVPSIRTKVVLPSGTVITFHGLHPRPPAPGENDTAIERDAELLMVAREVEQQPQRILVAGDLNDVAWSKASDLFLRTSRLLDPRRGRGFYNTFHAKLPLLRYPLDHIFHSTDLVLLDLQRLRAFGSDHFPMYVQLEHRPHTDNGQKLAPNSASEEKEVEEKIAEGR